MRMQYYKTIFKTFSSTSRNQLKLMAFSTLSSDLLSQEDSIFTGSEQADSTQFRILDFYQKANIIKCAMQTRVALMCLSLGGFTLLFLKPGFHIVVSVVSVVSVLSKKFLRQIQPYGNLTHNRPIRQIGQIQHVLRDRIDSISYNRYNRKWA